MATYKVPGPLRRGSHLPNTLVVSCPRCDSLIILRGITLVGWIILRCLLIFNLGESRHLLEEKLGSSFPYDKCRGPVCQVLIYLHRSKLLRFLPADVIPLLEKYKPPDQNGWWGNGENEEAKENSSRAQGLRTLRKLGEPTEGELTEESDENFDRKRKRNETDHIFRPWKSKEKFSNLKNQYRNWKKLMVELIDKISLHNKVHKKMENLGLRKVSTLEERSRKYSRGVRSL